MEGCGETESQMLCCWLCKNGTATVQDNLAFFKINLNMQLPYDQTIVLLSTCLRERKAYILIKTCTGTFIIALFIIAKS